MAALNITAVLVPALLLASAAVHSQSNDKVMGGLEMHMMEMPEDYGLLPNQWGWLNDDENESFDIYLNVGDYSVVGSCDQDCTDLDLVVTGTAEVGSDRAMDDMPYVNFSVSSAGYFHIRVEMAACSMQPCQWGVDVYQRYPY